MITGNPVIDAALVESLRSILIGALGESARSTCDEVECHPDATASGAFDGALAALNRWLNTPEVAEVLPTDALVALDAIVDAARVSGESTRTPLGNTTCMSGHPAWLTESVAIHDEGHGAPMRFGRLRSIVCGAGVRCPDWFEVLPSGKPTARRDEPCEACSRQTVYVFDRVGPALNPEGRTRLIGAEGVRLYIESVCASCTHTTTTERSLL